jgi:hypothetical protein
VVAARAIVLFSDSLPILLSTVIGNLKEERMFAVVRRLPSATQRVANCVASSRTSPRLLIDYTVNVEKSNLLSFSSPDVSRSIRKTWYSTTGPCGFIGGGSGVGGGFRMLSSPSASDSIDIGRWPIRRNNTILNIVPQGQKHVVERLGRLHSIEDSGYFFAIPFFDEIAYIIDVRERAIDIQPQVRYQS